MASEFVPAFVNGRRAKGSGPSVLASGGDSIRPRLALSLSLMSEGLLSLGVKGCTGSWWSPFLILGFLGLGLSGLGKGPLAGPAGVPVLPRPLLVPTSRAVHDGHRRPPRVPLTDHRAIDSTP